MGFEERLSTFISRVESIKDNVSGEEATKTSLIMPFFQILGYDVFNPMEFMPEFTADVGIKKGEKVDYAISLNGELTMLIEAKDIKQQLQKHDSQLFRYFGTTKAKFAILTNGIEYKFYTDLDEQNKMDATPFMTLNLLDMSESDLTELKKFQKENFDVGMILDTAADLKYMSLIKAALKEEFTNPTDDFVKYILNCDVYDGVKTQAVIEKYRPLIKKAIALYINEQVNDKIQNALKQNPGTESEDQKTGDIAESDSNDGIITTPEELQAFYIVKSLLVNVIPLDRISFKDTRSYFSITIDNKVTRWICRIYLKENVRFVIVHRDGKDVRYEINGVDEIYSLSDVLIERTKSLCE